MMDPYIIIEHNKQKYRTRTIKNAGQYPVWGEEDATSHFVIPLNSLEEQVTFSAYDQDLIFDDFLGTNVL